ncbi:hypothetical protein [Cellulophaga sp. BC115SP]|uniref:hypothetical protein n=1 Tax=Cellulophaga sp. BC115SP TaxID=2683263 RepID=UPI001412D220|nr:hypothetical protein [Cellulophaga sp. BC115SP]NBB31962.1 hypothetical protein [Cellulophaga sp. BC115SP]
MEQSVLDNPVIQGLLEAFADRAMITFRRKVRESKLEVTGELYDSIRAQAIEKGIGFLEARVELQALLRIKDMRVRRYKATIPYSEIEQWVKNKGLNSFAYVPGYKRSASEINTRQTYQDKVDRIAWAIMYKISLEPIVKRSYKSIYNEALAQEVLPIFFNHLHYEAVTTGAKQFKAIFNQ